MTPECPQRSPEGSAGICVGPATAVTSAPPRNPTHDERERYEYGYAQKRVGEPSAERQHKRACGRDRGKHDRVVRHPAFWIER
jgi:hypothetical protein